MTGISLLPFYSADATTKLARALSCYKGKHYFLSCQINMPLTFYLGSLCYNFLSFNRLDGVDKIMNPVLQFRFSGL